jgi:hypothetical protein
METLETTRLFLFLLLFIHSLCMLKNRWQEFVCFLLYIKSFFLLFLFVFQCIYWKSFVWTVLIFFGWFRSKINCLIHLIWKQLFNTSYLNHRLGYFIHLNCFVRSEMDIEILAIILFVCVFFRSKINMQIVILEFNCFHLLKGFFKINFICLCYFCKCCFETIPSIWIVLLDPKCMLRCWKSFVWIDFIYACFFLDPKSTHKFWC